MAKPDKNTAVGKAGLVPTQVEIACMLLIGFTVFNLGLLIFSVPIDPTDAPLLLLILTLHIWLIYKIWNGSNWARWIALLLLIVQLHEIIVVSVVTVAHTVSTGLYAIALCLLFTGQGRSWFQSRAKSNLQALKTFLMWMVCVGGGGRWDNSSEKATSIERRGSRSMASGLIPQILGFLAFCLLFLGTSTGSEFWGLRPPDEAWTITYAFPWVVAALLLGGISRFFAWVNAATAQEIEDERAKIRNLPYLLLCRPFSTDNLLHIENPDHSKFVSFPSYYYEPASIALEQLLAQAIAPELQLRVIGGSPTGPGVIHLSDTKWRREFITLIEKAQHIVVIPLGGEEIPWECHTIKKRGYLSKTIFFLPSRRELPSTFDQARLSTFNAEMKAQGFIFPEINDAPCFFALDITSHCTKYQAIHKFTYSEVRKVLLALDALMPGQ